MADFNQLGTELCNFCIQVMSDLSKSSGLSYGLINILFFVIMGPLSTLCFMGTTIIALSKWKYRKLTIGILGGIGILLIIGIVAPCIWAFFAFP